ncbi:hypothetical protein Fot_26541 [Forsythia ovata]|uniref:Neprosin activation peptide domain-containing protein n=1 Tax=Forsythia ovata TaxID=205694 RepID=A0ABD1UDN5_9LAMI
MAMSSSSIGHLNVFEFPPAGNFNDETGEIITISPLNPKKFLCRSNQNFQPRKESLKMKIIRDRLMKINKPSIKTIQSPDGDIIDCVLSHQQPAFDHPQLKGQKPMDLAERPKGEIPTSSMSEENVQLWSITGEFCPEGTIPIRRITEQDFLRASSIRRFGRKIRRPIRRDSSSNGHEPLIAMKSINSPSIHKNPVILAEFQISLEESLPDGVVSV